MNLDQLTEAVWSRLQEKPRALLIGEAPIDCHNYIYVNDKPYEAVVLGKLPPGELLHMPSDTVCRALLAGIPVFLSSEQYHHGVKGARLLCRQLYGAEQYLRQLGVKPLGQAQKIITAEQARLLRQTGQQPGSSRMTPLARDILEGREP